LATPLRWIGFYNDFSLQISK